MEPDPAGKITALHQTNSSGWRIRPFVDSETSETLEKKRKTQYPTTKHVRVNHLQEESMRNLKGRWPPWGFNKSRIFRHYVAQ